MGYDLFIWPADAAVSPRQAMAKLRRLMEADRPGPPRDPRLAAFAAEVERRNPWMASMEEPPPDVAPFEFSVYRDYAFAGIPWDFVTVVGAEVDGLARGLGLLVLDPQSKSVALPDALGGRPLEWAAAEEGREQFHDIVGQMGDAIGTTLDPVEGMQRFHEQMAAQGFRIRRPQGSTSPPGWRPSCSQTRRGRRRPCRRPRPATAS